MTLKKVDVQAYAEQVRTKRGWLTKAEVARRLGVKPATLSEWHHLLSPIEDTGHTHYYRQVDIEAFQSNYLSTEEAARILEMGKLTVQKWARNGRLISATTGHRYLFHRAEIERLRPENRLTAS